MLSSTKLTAIVFDQPQLRELQMESDADVVRVWILPLLGHLSENRLSLLAENDRITRLLGDDTINTQNEAENSRGSREKLKKNVRFGCHLSPLILTFVYGVVRIHVVWGLCAECDPVAGSGRSFAIVLSR